MMQGTYIYYNGVELYTTIMVYNLQSLWYGSALQKSLPLQWQLEIMPRDNINYLFTKNNKAHDKEN